MSWHLLVATRLPPATRTLLAWAEGREGVLVGGGLDGVHRSAIVRRLPQGGAGAPRPCAILYAPEPIDEEGLPQLLAEAVLGPRFQLRISVPGAGAQDRELATSLAAAIAHDAEGAVFDPQAEEIVAPPAARRASRRFAVRCSVPPSPPPPSEGEGDAVVLVGIVDAHGNAQVVEVVRESYAALAAGRLPCRVVRVAQADDGRELVFVEAAGVVLELTREQLVET